MAFARRSPLFLALLVPLIGAAACRDSAESTPPGSPRGTVETAGVRLPSKLLGLDVKVEDVGDKIKQAQRPFVTSVGLFSLREDDLVRATFQVSRLNRFAEPEDPTFRNSIISRIGTTKPEDVRVANTTVYVTKGAEQTIFAWFEDRGFFVLTTHGAYEFPRTLARRLVTVGSA